jgi:hypothetical protein
MIHLRILIAEEVELVSYENYAIWVLKTFKKIVDVLRITRFKKHPEMLAHVNG